LSAAEALTVLRRGVQRDLEALLNTRRRARSWPAHLDRLAVSALGYGIADFAAGAFNDAAARDRLRGEVETTIRRFEPRLGSVRVVLLPPRTAAEATLRLRIEAMLLVGPEPEPLAFDTVLDTTTATLRVRENAHV
jgi:type VI secretion system protein ImpF